MREYSPEYFERRMRRGLPLLQQALKGKGLPAHLIPLTSIEESEFERLADVVSVAEIAIENGAEIEGIRPVDAVHREIEHLQSELQSIASRFKDLAARVAGLHHRVERSWLSEPRVLVEAQGAEVRIRPLNPRSIAILRSLALARGLKVLPDQQVLTLESVAAESLIEELKAAGCHVV